MNLFLAENRILWGRDSGALLTYKNAGGYTWTKSCNNASEHVADIIQSKSTKLSMEVNITQCYEHTQRKKYHFGEVNSYLKEEKKPPS